MIPIAPVNWLAALEPRSNRSEAERHLRAELGADFPARLFDEKPSAGRGEGDRRDSAADWGLLRRFAQAIASLF